MFDLIVIGAGSGGLAAAKRAALAQKKVALIENDSVGGTCVTYGCVPKMWHAISMFAHQSSVANHHGWSFGSPSFDWGTVKPKLSAYIQSLNDRHEQKCLDAGIEMIRGTARLASPTSVEVNGNMIEGQRILICVGSKAVRLPIPGAELCDTSYEFFLGSVAIIGGNLGWGYIAVELASILTALGCKVDVIIRQPLVLRGFDSDLRQFLQDRYTQRGLTIHTDTTIEAIQQSSNGLKVVCGNGNKIMADKVIQAVGRVPFTETLNCDAVGVKTTKNGAIIVNHDYQTSVPSISALGDCIDQVQLTPVAIAQAREWVDKVLFNKTFPVDYNMIPTAVFSHPEAGTVGFSEDDAREKFDDISVRKLQFNPLTMALTDEHKEPVFMKLVMRGNDQHVIGLHVCCEGAAEIAQSLAVAMQKALPKLI